MSDVTGNFLLQDLPQELLSKCLDDLPATSLLQCRFVCGLWKKLIDETASLQYKIDLYAAQSSNNPDKQMATKDRLDSLRTYVESWYKGSFHHKSSVYMDRGNLWELAGGVLAQTIPGDNILGRHTALRFHGLPATSRQIKSRSWTLENIDVKFRDFTMDPGQDLLALARVTGQDRQLHLYLRTMSTGKPHPQAPTGTSGHLIHQTSSRSMHDLLSFSLRICGSYVAVLVERSIHFTELVVFEWKTGRVVLAIANRGIISYTFITDHHILCSVLTGLSHNQFEPEICFCVIDLTLSSLILANAIDHLQLGTRFLLPAFEDGEFPLSAQIYLDPLPGAIPATATTPLFSIGSSPGYAAGNGSQLCMIRLEITNGVHQRSLCLFAPVSTFLSHLAVETTVDWDDWGLYGARILQVPSLPQSWVCFVYGSRFVFKSDERTLLEIDGEPVLLEEDTDGEGEEWEDVDGESSSDEESGVVPGRDPSSSLIYACVLDFNRLSFQRFHAERFPASTIVTSKHESRWDAFRDRVQTSLPYCKTVFKLDAEQNGVQSIMISEDNLILVPPFDFSLRYPQRGFTVLSL